MRSSQLFVLPPHGLRGVVLSRLESGLHTRWPHRTASRGASQFAGAASSPYRYPFLFQSPGDNETSTEAEVIGQLNFIRDKILAKQDQHLHHYLQKMEIPLHIFGMWVGNENGGF